MEEVTGLTLTNDQEGIKDTKQTVATRGSDPSQAVVEISSDPDGAEIEIDGAFVGNAPRSRSLSPGEHNIKLRKKGYQDWERKIAVQAGETLEVEAALESK
jgi:hypothetical protein